MKTQISKLGLFLGLAVLPMGLACAKGDRGTTEPLRAAAGQAYTNDEIISLAQSLTEELEMPQAERTQVLEKLGRVLDDPGYRKDAHEQLTQRGVTGVIAFRLGEPGAVSSEKEGKALARLKGQSGNSGWLKRDRCFHATAF